MRMRTLFLAAMAAELFCSPAPQAGSLTSIELKPDDQEIGTIEVQGSHLDAYRDVATKTMTYVLWARGGAVFSDADLAANFKIEAHEESGLVTKYEGRLYESWTKYKIPVKYFDASFGPQNTHIAPVRRCNLALEQTSGAERADFLFRGGTITLTHVIKFRATPFGSPGRTIDAPVIIKCLPLDHNSIRAKLRIEPTRIEQMGKYLCPTELALHGLVESREKFTGKAIFVGPHYLSAITDLNYAKAGTRNVSATYKLNWKPKGGFTTANNGAPAKQDLTFHFNIADKNGKVVESPEERVQVSCKKVKVNAPTAAGGVTVNPAN